VPQFNTFRANIRGSAFTALHDSMFPGATSANPGYNVRVDITADKNGPASNGLFLVEASQAFPTDTDAGDVPFANPYPSAWTSFVDYTDIAVHNLLPSGAASPVPMLLFTRVVSADFPTASNPVAPLVGPALNPRINGSNLFNDQTISGTTPTLSWQPPAVGTASGYLIRAYQIVVGGNPSLEFKGSYYTTTTSVQLLPGVLSSGNSYWIEIESLYRKNVDISVSPHLESFPEGESDLGSGIISVQ
jgi:hypothetical protein